MIENLNKMVSKLMNQQEKIVELMQKVVIAQPKINRKIEGGTHKVKIFILNATESVVIKFIKIA